MKIRRLHEIDLARVALLPADEKRARLRRHKAGRPLFSYDPARAVIPDAVNAQPTLPLTAEPTSWEQIRHLLQRSARSPESFAANLEVTKLLFDFASSEGLGGIQLDLGRMPVGVGETVAYWSNAVLVKDAEVIVTFFDHRRANGLTATARHFVFSIMREHLAARHPDLDAKLAIIQFPQEGERKIKFIRADERARLLDYETLDRAVAETYGTWREVLEERLDEARAGAARGLRMPRGRLG